MNPIDKLLGWLYDRSGNRQNEQYRRMVSTNRKILALQDTQRRAAGQIRETQRFVSEHRRQF